MIIEPTNINNVCWFCLFLVQRKGEKMKQRYIISICLVIFLLLINKNYTYAASDGDKLGHFIYGEEEINLELINENHKVDITGGGIKKSSSNITKKVSLFSALPEDNDSIKYSGQYDNIAWTIDKYGNLNVKGTGEFKKHNIDDENFYYAPWHGYEDEILSAVVDIKDTTDLSQMFFLCRNLRTVVFTNTEPLFIENMQGTFADCNNLNNIIWGAIDTSKVRNMNAMFCNCIALKSIDLTQFDLSKVEIMSYMFYGCENVSEIKWGSKKPQNVKEMGVMFTFCWNLIELDLLGFNCDGVGPNSTGYMLYKCNRLERINSPSRMKNADIDLYPDDTVNGVFIWTKAGSLDEIQKISGGESSLTYVKVDKYDYWKLIENSYSCITYDRYYLEEDDYKRLTSNLSAYDRVAINVAKLAKWSGSCRGMSSWVALQNNGWETIGGRLYDATIDDDIMSKINFYHLQQFLASYMIDKVKFKTYSNAQKINILKEGLYQQNIGIISFSFVDRGKKVGHTICGVDIRLVMEGDKTDSGIDISDYKYCVIVYDPNHADISLYSDYNIYFNDDGSYYIPKYNSKNTDSQKDNYISNISWNKNEINRIDYNTGIVTNTIVNDIVGIYMNLSLDKEYQVSWGNQSIVVDKNGYISGDDLGVTLIPDESSNDKNISWATLVLPCSDEYVVSCEEEFGLISYQTSFSAYASVDTGGSIRITNEGTIEINSNENAHKEIAIGTLDDFNGNNWDEIYLESDSGSNISLEQNIIKGDSLVDTFIKVSKSNVILCSETINKYTNKVTLIESSNGIIIKENVEEDSCEKNDDKVAIHYEVTSQWAEGYNATIKIENISEEVLENWKIRFDYVLPIVDIWNAEVVSKEGDTYVIKNVGWNQDIYPGQVAEIGFSVKGESVCELIDATAIGRLIEHNVEDANIVCYVYDAWEGGYNASITIENNTDVSIEDWILEFDYSGEILGIWNAEIVEHIDNRYKIKNTFDNSIIPVGQCVSIGFTASADSDETVPVSYKLFSRD